MRHKTLKLFICTLAAVSINTAAFAAEPAGACQQFFDGTTAQTNQVLANQQMDYLQKRAALKAVFVKAIDVNWISQYVTGKNWNAASEQERSDFAKAYQSYLATKYIGSLDQGDFNEMKGLKSVTLQPTQPNNYTAHMQVEQTGDQPLVFDVQLTEAPVGTCRVHDFKVEGVSQLTLQESEVQGLLAHGGIKAVTQKLGELANAQ